jgi:hypothetical protein
VKASSSSSATDVRASGRLVLGLADRKRSVRLASCRSSEFVWLLRDRLAMRAEVPASRSSCLLSLVCVKLLPT